LLAGRNGDLVFLRCDNRGCLARRNAIASISKSVLSVLTGMAFKGQARRGP
jgi:hypothetical protein